MSKIHVISNEHLTIEKVGVIVYDNYCLELSSESRSQIIRAREFLDSKIESTHEPLYGITTGFGSLCDVSIDNDKLSQLQSNLVMSHACGMGDEVPVDIIKMMMLLKIQSLSYGVSGVDIETVERLIDLFNNNIIPLVFQQGSLGASGDLAPLAHLSLPLIGEGEVYYKGERCSARQVNSLLGWDNITLKSKEGLALLNGTQFMSAYSVWALLRSQNLYNAADFIAAVSLDGYDGCLSPFLEAVHMVRPHVGQIRCAESIRKFLDGSKIITRSKSHVQDPYSFRCVPQVHGAVSDTIEHVKNVVTVEINSATDNPTILPDEDMIISAGNFHGEPLAFAMDFLAIAISELANISGQRIYQLIAGKRGLPKFLVAKAGINSGFMIPQYTAISIVSQNKQLCSPASVDSIESSLGQEDHVSMGANAATKCYRVILNSERVLGIELMNAMQALEFRRPLKSSPVIERVFDEYRKVVHFISEDEIMYNHLNISTDFVVNHIAKII